MGFEVNRSSSHRVLLGAFLAMFLALVSLSMTTSPAQGDSSEGSPVVNPSYRTKAAKISAGDDFACAIAGAAGHVYCWGGNSAGQLGNGTTVDSSTPVQVTGISGAVEISAGGNHACVILVSGLARCWGGGGAGQLGTGGTGSSSVPVSVAGGNFFTSISAGRAFTCGTTASQVRCWGTNESGQLGNGTFDQKNFPFVASVPGTPKFVNVGRNQACAVNTSKTLYCWGDNSNGQLGIGSVGPDQPTPQQVFSLTGVEAVSSGTFHTCAQSSAASGGGTWCWGAQFNGLLGNGATSGIQPLPVHPSNPDANGDRVVTAGDSHNCVTNAFFLRCWGENDRGQLGNGTNAPSTVPFRVPGYDTEVPVATAGYDFTCVQYTSGKTDCWGRNDKGQLGNGTTADSSTGVRTLDRPAAPTSFTVKPGDHSLTFSWDPIDDNGAPLTNVRLRDADGKFDVLAPGGASNYTVTGLTEGESYTPMLSGINDIGEGQALQRVPITLGSLPYLEVSDVSYAEGDSGLKTMTFTVTRFGKTAPAVSVKAETANGNGNVPAAATQPSDYTRKAPTLISFPAGVTSKTFKVTTKGDLLTEDDESFYVLLSSPVGAEIWDGLGVGTLTNDDAGQKPAYSINNVDLVEGDAGTSNMVFTITRSGSTAVAGSVKYHTLGLAGNATAGEDFTNKAPTSVSFPVGVTSKNVSVAIKGDLVAEGDEYFQVVLSDAVNGDLPFFPWGYGQILNDDSSAPTSIAIGDVTVEEGDGFSKSVTLTITRTGNLAGTTTLKYRTQDGTAVAPGDYTAKAPTSLSFAPGVKSKTISITVKGGSVDEPDEALSVVLSDVTGAQVGVGTATLTILDDD